MKENIVRRTITGVEGKNIYVLADASNYRFPSFLISYENNAERRKFFLLNNLNLSLL